MVDDLENEFKDKELHMISISQSDRKKKQKERCSICGKASEFDTARIIREPGSLLNLHLSVSTRNVLARNGIKSINTLESLTYWELLQLRGVGKKTAEEIEVEMRAYKGTPDWQFYR